MEAVAPAEPTIAAEEQSLVTNDVEETEEYTGRDDDAVIVPALPQAAFSKPKAPLITHQHLVQKLAFRQTIIPVMLTLAKVCFATVVLGFLASADSPFVVFRQGVILAGLLLLGTIFGAMAVLGILQVRSELSRRSEPIPPNPR